MQTATSAPYSKTSIFGLFGELKNETKTFIKEEVQLAKTEISENVSAIGRNAVSIAIGGFVAFTGAILFLVGLGLLLGFAFEKLGLDRMLAGFVGFAVLGLIVASVGYMFIAKALKGFKHSSMAPEKTIETIKDFNHPGVHEMQETEQDDDKKSREEEQPKMPKRSVDEIQASVEATEAAMGDTMHELKRRLRPAYASYLFKNKFRQHPYRWNFVAMGTGLAGVFLMKRKLGERNGHHNGHNGWHG